MAHVERQRLGLVCGIGDAGHARAGGGGELGVDARTVEANRIISHGGLLVVVAEGGGVEVFALQTGDGLYRWLHHHVEQVYTAGAAQMGVGEAVDGVQAVVVARRAVAIGAYKLFGAQLDHAKGSGGAGEVAALEAVGIYLAGADKRVDITRHALVGLCP